MRLLLITATIAAACLTAACQDEPEIGEADDAGDLEMGAYGAAGGGAEITPAADVCSRYGALDTDSDGLIRQTEYNEFGEGVFEDWDLDDDSRLSEVELEQCWNAGGWTTTPTTYNYTTAWSAWDDDSDGFLTQDEFFGEDEFAEWDTDGSDAFETGEWL